MSNEDSTGVQSKVINSLPSPTVLGEDTLNSSSPFYIELLNTDFDLGEATNSQILLTHSFIHALWDFDLGEYSKSDILGLHHNLAVQMVKNGLTNVGYPGTLDDECKLKTVQNIQKHNEIIDGAVKSLSINDATYKLTEVKGAKVVEVEGLAHAEGEWKGVWFLGDEIKKGMDSLLSKRIHYDHDDDESKDVQGFVTEISWNADSKGIWTKGLVFDPRFVEFVESGGLAELEKKEDKKLGFSVTVYTRDETVDGKTFAYDYRYDELTLTFHPACKICFASSGTVYTLCECEHTGGKNMKEESEQQKPEDKTSEDVSLDGQDKLDASVTKEDSTKKLSETDVKKEAEDVVDVEVDADVTKDKKTEADVATHEALLKEKTDAIIATAAKIATEASTMSPDELRSAISHLNSISWQIGDTAEVVATKSLDDNNTDESVTMSAKEHLEAALSVLKEDGDNTEVEKVVNDAIASLSKEDSSIEQVGNGENALSEVTKKLSEDLSISEKKLTDKDKEILSLKKELKEREVNTMVDDLISGGNIIPAEKDSWNEVLLSVGDSDSNKITGILKERKMVKLGEEDSKVALSKKEGPEEEQTEEESRRIT